MATFSNAIKKELNLYYSSSGTLLNKTGDLEANANDRETFNVNVYLEDGVTSNSTTLINFTPEERNTFTTHWFTMFYRGLVDFIVNNEEQPRTFAKFTMTIDSIVLLMKDGKINFTHNLTVIQRYGNTHLGNFSTLSELITTNPPTQALDEDLSVAFVYSGETEVGFYQVEENGATYQWVKKNDIFYNLRTKQYNVATLLVGKGFSNPNGLPTIEQSIVYQLMQEISYLSVRVSDLEVSLGVAENTLANHISNKNNPHEVKALQVDFDNTGTDLNETNTQDVIKEVNDKINSNTTDLETFKDVTVPTTYETIASANIHKARTVVLETFKNTTVPNTYETKVNATVERALKVDKITKIIGLDLENDITISEFRIALGNASQVVAGLMSVEDKIEFDNLMLLFQTDGDNIVNTIAEILAIFQNYPEGEDLVTILASKVDKVAGKQLSTNDLTNVLKDNYDTAYNHSQVLDLNPHKTKYAQLEDKPTTIEQLGVTNVYNKEYIDERIDTIIAGTVEGVSGAEIVDARQGEVTLGANITKVKSHLAESMNYGNVNENDFDLDKINYSENVLLDIPTYVEQDNAVVHPSVLYFPDKWNGYKYWMANTPYTNLNSIYENPSIFVSDNGIDWIVPNGLTNPVYGYQAETGGYNADTHIFMSTDKKTMYLIWREKIYIPSVKNLVRMLSSVDGINWSGLKTIVDVNGKDNASPSVIYDRGKFKLFTVDLLNPVYALQLYETTNPEGEWEYVKDIPFPTPSGKSLWHFEIKMIGNMYVNFYTVCPITGQGGANEFYLAKSYDLENWTYKKLDIAPYYDKNFYKGSIIPRYDGGISLDCWYGIYKNNQFVIVKNNIKFSNDVAEELSIYQDLTKNNKFEIDTFIKPDSVGLGATQNGLDWVAESGVLNIEDNFAIAKETANNLYTIDVSCKTGILQCDFYNTSVTSQWLVFGLKSTSVFYRVGIADAMNGLITLQRISGGVTEIASYTLSSLNLLKKINLMVEITKTKVFVYLNSKLIITADVDLLAFGSKIGVQLSTVNAKVKNFLFSYNSLNVFSMEKIKNDYYTKVRDGILRINKNYISDSFNRINNASLGTSPANIEWENAIGGFNILNNNAVAPTASTHISSLNVGKSNFTASANIIKVGSSTCIAIVQDSSNYYRYGAFGAGADLTFEKIVVGTRTVISAFSGFKLTDDSIIKIKVNNNTFELYYNDILLGTVTDNSLVGLTKVGFQTNEVTTQYGSILIEV